MTELGQRLDQSCDNIRTQLSLNSIQNDFSQMVTKVSQVASDVKNASADRIKHLSDLSHGKCFITLNQGLSQANRKIKTRLYIITGMRHIIPVK